MINHDLARERNLDPETIQKIEEYQNFRTVLGEMYKAGKIGARVYREEWVSNEYKLQDLWGFERETCALGRCRQDERNRRQGSSA